MYDSLSTTVERADDHVTRLDNMERKVLIKTEDKELCRRSRWVYRRNYLMKCIGVLKEVLRYHLVCVDSK